VWYANGRSRAWWESRFVRDLLAARGALCDARKSENCRCVTYPECVATRYKNSASVLCVAWLLNGLRDIPARFHKEQNFLPSFRVCMQAEAACVVG